MEILLYLSAGVICLTALVHSVLGEKLLIGPMMAMREGPLRSWLARRVIRFAWHLTTVLMLITAFALVLAANAPSPAMQSLVWAIGGAYLAVGVFDGIVSRGKHIGWWMLTAAGGLALASLL